MKTKYKILIVGFIVSNSNLFAQTITPKSASSEPTAKSKKLNYIENYIANFPYKNSDIYPVISNVSLWDTTGAVPVIDINTIMMNQKPTINGSRNSVFENKPQKQNK